MRIKFRQGICLLTSWMLAASVASYPVRAEEFLETDLQEQNVAEEIITASEEGSVQEEEAVQDDEDWLSVATAVLKYYAEDISGLKPYITESDRVFYDVIQDGNIDISDATYFLTIYATLAACLEFEGYIPKRESTTSQVVTTTSINEEMTTTTISSTTSIPTITTITNTINSPLTTSTPIVTTTQKTTTSISKTTTSATTISESNTEPMTTTTTTVSTRPPMAYGIDVSVYQGKVDWQSVKESGVEFAIIRAGYGKHANQEDRYFDTNMESANRLGINCGAYWFSYATTPEDAEKEADAFFEVIKGYKFEYPIFFDYETSAQNALNPSESTAIINAFCKRMESYGYYVSLCSYVGFLNYKIESEIFDRYDVWIAHYDVRVPWFSRNYGIWQYSCTGKVPGIDTDVDLNYAYYDYPTIMTEYNLNGF